MDIRAIAESIIGARLSDDTLEVIKNQFFMIAKEHILKAGYHDIDEDGLTKATPEWLMIVILFAEQVRRQVFAELVTLNNIPEDLLVN